MYGEKRDRLITIRCVTCQKWTAIRLDPDDFYRHVGNGVYVQHAFADRDGKPYLSASERELFISKCCSECWSLLCSSNPLDYD